MEYLESHLRIPFDLTLDSWSKELNDLFAECDAGKAHVMIMHTGVDGRNGCYRLIGTRTDGSARPTPRVVAGNTHKRELREPQSVLKSFKKPSWMRRKQG